MHEERLTSLLKKGTEQEGLLDPETVGGLAVIADLSKDSVKILTDGNGKIKSIETKVYDINVEHAARGAVKGILEAQQQFYNVVFTSEHGSLKILTRKGLSYQEVLDAKKALEDTLDRMKEAAE